MMSFRSILFNAMDRDETTNTVEAPACFSDLNLDQVARAIFGGRLEQDLRSYFYSPLRDVDTVIYRQEISLDLENEALFTSIKAFITSLAATHMNLGLVEKLEYKGHKEGWFVEAASVYCRAINNLLVAISELELNSRGFLAFREFLTSYTRSTEFTDFCVATEQVKTELAAVRYTIVIKGNWVQIRKYADEIDYSQEVEQTFEKFKQGAVKDYQVDLATISGMNHVKAQILEYVSRIYPEVFNHLDQYYEKYQHFFDVTIMRFHREIQFYVSYLDYVDHIKKAGMRFCYPKVSPKLKATVIKVKR
jgi:DNA mismatch repair protein MutS